MLFPTLVSRLRWEALWFISVLACHLDVKRRQHRSNSESSSRPAGGSIATTRQQRLGAPQPTRRRWAFRLLAVFLIPVLVAAALELALRLAGYGYPTGFFKPQKIGEESRLVENDKFGLRFFPPELARSPSPVVMKANRIPGTCRIFIFGESAALGDPRPAYGAGRYLEVLLRERFPQGRFEVVCVAMTAINSHAIRAIASECARHEGDLWILYLGNNEMIGPFGATGVIGAKSPPLALVRLSLTLQKARLGQLLLTLGRRLKEEPSGGTWGGMEMWVKNRVPPGDPRKAAVYENFRLNLEQVLKEGRGTRGGGARVIVSTMAVNLRDCPPLATDPGTNLPPAETAEFERLEREAATAVAETNLAKAAEALGHAARLEPGRADVEFRLAECLFAEGDTNGAKLHFGIARDRDALPFRADSRINGDIEQLARQFQGSRLGFFDAGTMLGTNSPAGIPGREFFYEHVHLNFDGNYLLARAWAERAEELLPAALTGKAVGPWCSQEICERRLGLTDWNRVSVLEDVLLRLTQPPLSTQANNARRVERLRTQLKDLRSRMNPQVAGDARQLYLDALARAPEDHRLHENFAEFLEAVGDLNQAVTEWQRVSELLPHHHLGYFQSGRLLAWKGEAAAAQAALLQAVRLRPDLSEGWLELGKLALALQNPEGALEFCERARLLLPQDHRVYYVMGKALSKLNRRPEAIQRFRQAVKLKPNYWEARYSLGEELAFDGKDPEARTQFQEVLRLKPDHALAHLNLGVALFKLDQRAEAVQEFEAALRLDPGNRQAREYLEQLRGAPKAQSR